MFELNLIKDKMARAEVDRRLYSLLKVFFFVSFVILLLLLYKSVSLSSRIVACKKEMASLQAEIANNRRQLGVERLESAWEKNYSQLQLIDKVLDVRTNLWSSVYTLACMMPEGICINLLRTGRLEEMKWIFEIAVNSPDKRGLEIINNLMNEMARNPRFGKVRLDSQQRKAVDKGEVELFSISIPR